MKYIKNLSQYLIFERLNSASGKMMRLVDYFEKSKEEKENELPKFFDENYPHIFDDWTMDNSHFFLDLEEFESEEEANENIIYPENYELLSDEALNSYKEFLIEIIDNVFESNDYNLNLSVLPLYVTFNYEGDIENDWLVHFTETEATQKNILKMQCFHGITNMYNLAITSATEDPYDKDGYCFGFDLNNVHHNFKSNYSHYGDYGILFKSSGINLYHNGDDETQTIFIGNQVSNLIPFWYDDETKELYNKDNSIRTKDFFEFFEKITSV
jgi:hypothetical protein